MVILRMLTHGRSAVSEPIDIQYLADKASMVVVQQLMIGLFPGSAQPIPSYVMSSYDGTGSHLDHVPQGDKLTLKNKNSHEATLIFTTTHGFEYQNFSILSQQMVSEYELELKLNRTSTAKSTFRLSLYIDMPFDKATQVMEHMIQNCEKIYLIHGSGESECSCELAMQAYLNHLVENDHNLLESFQFFIDYLMLPQKFLRVDISCSNLNFVIGNQSSLILKMSFRKPWPRKAMIADGCFKLNVVPIANRFEYHCEPILYNRKQRDLDIIVDRHASEHNKIITLKSVEGYIHQTGERITYHRAYGHEYRHKPYYLCKQDRLICHGGGLKAQTLSVIAWICQGSHPSYINTPVSLTREPGLGMKVTMLHSPTLFREAQGAYKIKALVDVLSLISHRSLSATMLKSMLSSLLAEQYPEVIKKINGIIGVDVSDQWIAERGRMRHQKKYALTCDESFYENSSEMHLWGIVLHMFFTKQDDGECDVYTTMLLMPSRELMKWNPLKKASCLN